MVYAKRIDGRDWTELRPMSAKVGVIDNAHGSATFSMGKTVAFAAVYGPRELYPKFLQDPKKGLLRCHYNMMPFSGAGERVRPGPSRRSREISLVMANALLPVMDMTQFPNAVVDVFVEFTQTDAGSRCAGICAAALALADAGLTMKDLVTAVAVGKIDDKFVVDLNYEEDSYKEAEAADVPVAVLPNSGKISLLQMDGIIEPEELPKLLELAREATKKIYEVQKKALLKKFEVDVS